ncbi:MAG TPA: hypothetical protein H9902_07800 [Candidatus Stackebrandtia faecavium]|nr:hypothetical protein [Candidatus Stackebrandtia faecavium]
MPHAHTYTTMSIESPGVVHEALDLAAGGTIVRLMRGDEAHVDLGPVDPDAVFRPLLTEIERRAAEITAAHPDPDDLERWQRAQRLHRDWQRNGTLPSTRDYAVELRKLDILSEEEVRTQADAMVRADSVALAVYPLPQS